MVKVTSKSKKAVKKVSKKKSVHKVKVPEVEKAPEVKVEPKVVIVKDTSFTDEQLNQMTNFGTGILAPKLSYRFKVSFVDPSTLQPLPESEKLSRQLVRMSDVELRDFYINKMVVHFEDDVINQTFSLLKSLERSKTFTMKVEYVDGNEAALRTHYIKGAKITNVLFGKLDYAESHAVELKAVVTYTSIAIV